MLIVTKEKYDDLKEQIKEAERRRDIAYQDRDFARADISKEQMKVEKLEEILKILEEQNAHYVEKMGEMKKEFNKAKKQLKEIYTILEKKPIDLKKLSEVVINNTTKSKKSKKGTKNAK